MNKETDGVWWPYSYDDIHEYYAEIQPPQVLGAGETIVWTSDGSIAEAGWEVCFYADLRPDQIRVNIVADNYPSEISWELTDSEGEIVDQASATNAVGYTLVEVEAGNCYTWSIADSYGDGICCAYGHGSWTIEWMSSDGSVTLIHSGDGQYGDGESFVVCDPSDTNTDTTILEGQWQVEDFTYEDMTGKLRRFNGVVQDGGHFTLKDVAIIEFDDSDVNSLMLGVLTMFPDAPSMFQRTVNLMMECEDDICQTQFPIGQTIDALDIATFAGLAQGSTTMSQNVMSLAMRPFFDLAFRGAAAQYIYWAMQAKNYLFDKNKSSLDSDHDLSGDSQELQDFIASFDNTDTDLGGGIEDTGDMAASWLEWATSGESERLFDLGDTINALVEFLDESLGQLTFAIDIDVTGRILSDDQINAGLLPFEVSVANFHIVIDNGDQCTGNIVCAVLVALGEAFPGTTGHEDSVLGCVKFKFVFELDREDWQNGDGVDYSCLDHADFEDIKANILDRTHELWTTLTNAPGIKDYGKHGHLCFHDDHCEQDGDVCVVGLCYSQRGYGGYCLRDYDCASGDCLLFECIDGRDGSLCNTDDDCDSNRCNYGEVPPACREKNEWGEACAKDSDCGSGDCLFFQCIDGRDGDLCNTDDDCNSGRCNLAEVPFRCREKKGWHEGCTKDGDCASGDCLFFQCIDGRDGDLCNTDDDCHSGRCNLGDLRCTTKNGWNEACAKDSDCASGDCLFFVCIDGRENDWCNTHDDCQSGSCSWWFTCD